MEGRSNLLSRRTVVGGIVAVTGLAAAGCSGARTTGDKGQRTRQPANSGAPVQAASMTVYRNPSCGCCEAWAGIARAAGYRVNLIDSPNMPAIKRKYGVPESLASCHTAVAGNYAIEGHVPLEDVKRLLARRPAKIKGIGVPGMPVGAPGMEMPDGMKQPFQVMAFDSAGRVRPFSA